MRLQNFLTKVAVLGSAIASIPFQQRTTSPTLYSMDNNPAGSSIVSLSILPNGNLATPIRTSTGGKGLHVGSPGGDSPGPDTLFTQNSVVVGDNVCIVE